MGCKGLEIRPIRGGYMLTNQRRVYVDQSERRSSKFDQSEPSSQNAHARYPPEDIKGTGPSFLPFPSITQYQHHVYLCMKLEELSKNTSASSGVTESSDISSSCNPGVLYGGAT